MQSIPPEWWQWAVAAFYGVDRIWLAVAVAVSAVLGMKLGDGIPESGFVLRFLLSIVGMAALFLIFLALTNVNPQFFNAEDLARSQVSI